DTFKLFNTDNVGITLDLTAVGNTKLTSIERFDITGTENNTLSLGIADLLALQDAQGQSGFNVFSSLGGVAANTGRQQVMVDGNAGDNLILTTSAPMVGTVSSGGNTYNVYDFTTAQVQLLVDSDVKVTFTGAAAIQLASLTSSTLGQGFVINGQCSGDRAGNSVSGAGDVNGDGYGDFIVGASSYTGGSAVGRSYVVYGGNGKTSVDLSAITGTSSLGFAMYAEAAGDNSGISVSAAGDVNGDGLADLIVGAYASDPASVINAGRSYVVFGKTGNGAVYLSALTTTTTAGFVINGQSESDYSGYSVSSAGDVNGDGLADLIVGAMNSDSTGGVDAGRSYVVFGKTSGAAINLAALTAGGSTAGFVITGQAASDYSGTSVSSAGDVNGDGLADLIVGVRSSDPAGGTDAGRSYVVFGKTSGTVIDLSALTAGSSTAGFVINGQAASDQSGYSVSSAGDLNGDGLDDLIVSADGADGSAGLDSGRAYVVYGQTSGAAVDLSTLTTGASDRGFVINGMSAGERIVNVASAGDLNGDGFNDLIVGAYGSDPAGGTNAGRSYVVYGGGYVDVSLHSVIGTIGLANTLTGTATADTLIGRDKADTLTGAGGADVMYGGAGNDTLVLNNSNVASLNVAGARIDGGTGVDTFKLFNTDNVGITLDLTAVGNTKLTSIERFDITGTANNTLKLALSDILALQDIEGQSGFNAFTASGAAAGRQQVVVDGDSGDQVLVADLSTWTQAASVSFGGHTYSVYDHGSAKVELLIDQNVSVAVL
ncbi:MAG: hypothetical protein WA159_20935, partial [Variovorax sp.]